jgi:hypothetical protein
MLCFHWRFPRAVRCHVLAGSAFSAFSLAPGAHLPRAQVPGSAGVSILKNNSPAKHEIPGESCLQDNEELSPLIHRDKIACSFAQVNLARAGDFLIGVIEQLHPLGQPAHCTGNGEEDREHRHREAHRLVDDA